LTDDERLTSAANTFAVVFDRERHLPGAERLKEAYRAARRTEGTRRPENTGIREAIERRNKQPIVPNDISDERARKIIAAIALAHDTTSADVRSSARDAAVVAAREKAAYELARAGFAQRAIARLLRRSWSPIVRTWIENHERRVAETRAPQQKGAAHG
jgi:hypothetical protein